MADHVDNDDDYQAHVTPMKTYVAVLAALLALTALMVMAYRVRLGGFNVTVLVGLATIQAALVGGWFMHLKSEKKFNNLFFVGAVLLVGVFLAHTLNDTLHRGQGLNGARWEPVSGSAHGVPEEVRDNGLFTPLPSAPASGHRIPAPADDD